MKRFLLFITIVLISSCLPVRITHNNELVIKQKPKRIDNSIFEKINSKYGVDTILPVWDDLGGLRPDFPIAFGVKYGYGEKGIFSAGCMFPAYYTLFVETDTGIIHLKTIEELRNFYAPIESKEEALSYSILCTNFYPQYEFDIPFFYRKYKTKINTTYVVKKDNLYEVQLFYYELCGCGPHYYYAVKLELSENGEILSKDFIKLYKDPKEDRLCVD